MSGSVYPRTKHLY